MRNFKKFLALVLATMMVLGGMVTVSAAEETAAAESVDYDAIYQASAEDLAALDILKGSIVNNEIDFALQNSVTRWQMALFVARIMTGETNDLYWSKVTDNTTPFDDVTNYFGAISYVSENGIVTGKGWIAGVGDNCFDPNGDIKVEEALTMAVRALGYKQLQYPQGFMTVAEDLGLTDGLEDLAIGTALTRGQMVQILKNMLYVKVDGAASFAQQNFGLEEKVYVVVATELQYMVGTERVDRVDYEGMATNKQTKYVALAPLNADGTYDFSALVHFTEKELGLEQGESELKMGYSYTVRSFTKFANVYDVVANTTKTVKNYGDEGKAIVGSANYNGINYSNTVKVDGTTYKLVKSYSDLNNKSTYAGKTPELVVHSLYKSANDFAASYYIYDDNFNIMTPDGQEVALLYNRWTNTYYVKVGNGYREATEADFAKYAVSGVGSSGEQYGITTDATDLITVSFSELTLIDDNNDGKWDRGIYIPYSVGQYTTTKVSAWNAGTSSNAKASAAYVNGTALYVYGANNKDAWSKKSPVQQDSLFFNERPKTGDYVVYYYNPYSRVFTVVENLGTPKSGTVQNMTQGTYAWNSGTNTYIYNGATVTIDGNTYKLGYRWTETYGQHAGDSKDLALIDKNLSSYGYSEAIYSALVGSAYKKMEYLVLAGRVIKAGDAGNDCGWMAFDYGSYDKDENITAYTSYKYEGDIVGVDADGNILVKAYVDNSGAQQIAKIGSINGFSYGLLVEDYAALQYQFSGIGSLGATAMDTMKKAVICDFFKTLTADVNGGDEKGKYRQYLFIVTGVSDDGVYEIYTDHELYWGDNGMSYRQPDYLKQTANITFINGISTQKVWTNSSTDTQYVVVTDDETTLLVVGKDGMKAYTGTLNGTLNLHYDATTTPVTRPVYAYSISNDFIFVASASEKCDDIWDGDWDADAASSGYTYYMVYGRNNYAASDDNLSTGTAVTASYTSEGVAYKYTNLYNINTGKTETKTVIGGLPKYNSATAITSGYAYNTPKPIGAIYAEKNGEWTLLTTDLIEIDAVDVATGYRTTCYYAKDSKTVLEDLLYGGSVDGKYASVYSSAALTKDEKAASANILLVDIDLDGDYADDSIYDPFVSFKFDVITYTADTKYSKSGVYAVTLANDKASSDGKYPGALYYDYVAGKSFAGTVIKDATKINEVESSTTALGTAKTKALAALDKAIGNYDTAAASVQNVYNAYAAKIGAALTVAEVNAQKAAAVDAIAKAIADDNSATATNKTNAETALKNLKADLAEGLALDADNATLKQVSGYIAEYEQMIADAKYSAVMTEINWASGLVKDAVDEIKAEIKAEEDAKPALTSFVKNADGTYTIKLQNVAGTQTVDIYNLADNTKVMRLTLSGTLATGVTVTVSDCTDVESVTWTGNGTERTIVITPKMIDATQSRAEVFAAGNYSFVVRNASAELMLFAEKTLG